MYRMVKFRKYTIVKFNEDGFPQSFRFKLKCLLRGDGRLKDHFIIEGLKYSFFKFRVQITVKDDEQFILWGGIQEPNVSKIVSQGAHDRYGYVVIEKYWPAFDSRYLHRAKKSVYLKPILCRLNPVKGKEILTTYYNVD